MTLPHEPGFRQWVYAKHLPLPPPCHENTDELNPSEKERPNQFPQLRHTIFMQQIAAYFLKITTFAHYIQKIIRKHYIHGK
jgi:hypothetical protein